MPLDPQTTIATCRQHVDPSGEGASLEMLTQEEPLAAFEYHGFWQPMDTLRDKNHLEALWAGGVAPWRTWE